ncbi:hypothetical protein [Halococcus sp. IIIV-5B]|uniref:hypothetical protein n=1 Tax=Halococcus sp. IIIV-5B TaxID=2321230 RepID=UPI001314D275|nr:hypothetical protein [Halococcus sp. IIIV-5B]
MSDENPDIEEKWANVVAKYDCTPEQMEKIEQLAQTDTKSGEYARQLLRAIR